MLSMAAVIVSRAPKKRRSRGPSVKQTPAPPPTTAPGLWNMVANVQNGAPCGACGR